MALPYLLLFVTALAAARVTRLITTDKISEPVREWIVGKLGPAHAISYLVYCRWCTGIYASAVASVCVWWGAGLRHLLPVSGWFAVPALALAFSYVIGLLVRAEPN